MTVRANPATMGGASTKSMATSVHVSLATQVSTGWSLQVQGDGPLSFGRGREDRWLVGPLLWNNGVRLPVMNGTGGGGGEKDKSPT